MQSEKIKQIELSYTAHARFTIENLEHRKHWEEGRVYDFGIKWDKLWIRLDNENGEVLEEEINTDVLATASENIDWKRPHNIHVETDANWYNLNDYINLTREVNLGRED